MRSFNEFVYNIINQIGPIVTQIVLHFAHHRERLQYGRLKQHAHLTNIATNVMHHREYAIVHKLSVLPEVGQQQAIPMHYLDRGKSKLDIH